MNKLWQKLALNFVAVAITVTIVALLAVNLSYEGRFRSYVKERQAINNHRIIQTITNIYKVHGSWSDELTDLLPQLGIMSGVSLKVLDLNRNVVAETSPEIEAMMMGENAKVAGETAVIPVVNDASRVGDVYITPLGDIYGVPSEDLRFRESINRLLLLGGAMAALVGLLLSYFMAIRMTAPLEKMTAVAKKIEAGDYDERVDVSSKDEIGDLAYAFNHLAQTLERQEDLRRNLTADISHELRTPLATIRSHIEAYIDGVMEPSTENIISIHEETIRLSRLVDDLGELAKLESDKVNIVKTKIDLNDVAEKVVFNLRPLFEEKGVSIELSKVTQTLSVKADADKLYQVFFNLLHNALKFTSKGGRAEIRLEKNGKNALAYIKDNGIGIDLLKHSAIFERFYRVEKSRNRSSGGAGIGLTVVKDLVEVHDGKISVESLPGKGTEFTIVMPLFK